MKILMRTADQIQNNVWVQLDNHVKFEAWYQVNLHVLNKATLNPELKWHVKNQLSDEE